MSREAEVQLRASLEGSESQSAWNKIVENSLESIDLRGIDLQNYDLRGFRFRRCLLDDANLSGCRLRRVTFEEASLENVRFVNADLREASFLRARAPGADFSGATLEDADLSWANLQGALLTGIDLAQVRLWKTDLREAAYDPFTPRREQDFISVGRRNAGAETVSLREFLHRLSGIMGESYRLKGDVDGPTVEVPKDLRENPRLYLNSLIKEHQLKVLPRPSNYGGVLYYEVVFI